MDSKLRWTAILSSLAAILIIALSVLFTQDKPHAPQNESASSVTAGKDSTEGDGSENSEGGSENSEGGSENSEDTDALRDPNRIGDDLRAFERDESFFDPEKNEILDAAKDMSNRLSLMVTSVEKDLRIQIVDNEGIPVTGNSFLVELQRVEPEGKKPAADGKDPESGKPAADGKDPESGKPAADGKDPESGKPAADGKDPEGGKTTEEADPSKGQNGSGSNSDGTYKDLDRDGIIYIGDLQAGEYLVQLSPIAGYKVPVGQTRVKVKDKVEFLPINDISLLIKKESEIDAAAEDSGQRDALSDADKTEMTDLKAFTGKTKAGIDVSKWNGNIDWDKAKNAGVQFAIVRAGYRGSVTGSLVQDICFDANMKGASAAGVPVGIYFFTQAVNEVEAVEEASAALEWIRQYEITYPIFIDTEGAGGNGRADGLDADMRTKVCEAFCRTVENAGYEAGVYASRNWYDHNLHTRQLEDYYIWLAEYRSVPLYQGYYRMWQYSSKGKVDGIEGNVDMNIMYE